MINKTTKLLKIISWNGLIDKKEELKALLNEYDIALIHLTNL
jgi:hypothetical protein